MNSKKDASTLTWVLVGVAVLVAGLAIAGGNWFVVAAMVVVVCMQLERLRRRR